MADTGIIHGTDRGVRAIFNIGISELILVLLVAFLVVGPKDLPKVARWLGRAVKKLRLLVREVRKETGWDESEKEIRDTKSDLHELKKEADISGELHSVSREVDQSLQDVEKELKQAEQDAHAAGTEPAQPET